MFSIRDFRCYKVWLTPIQEPKKSCENHVAYHRLRYDGTIPHTTMMSKYLEDQTINCKLPTLLHPLLSHDASQNLDVGISDNA